MRRIKITRMALGLKIYLPSDHFNIFPSQPTLLQGCLKPNQPKGKCSPSKSVFHTKLFVTAMSRHTACSGHTDVKLC